jgi:two-component system cell cycle sensor histidine kinase/response regulator CckA
LPKADPIRESLGEVVKAGQAAARLTKQLLAFSRQTVSDLSTFNPNEVVVATEQMLRRLIGEHIDLVTNVGADLGSVEMDRGQLDQVLMNLVVNARDAMPDGGTLTIATANRRVDTRSRAANGDRRPGEYVVISVSDSGTGMSDEVKARIFEPFFTTKPEDKGTGLGLATCFGIIAEAGGHIEVRSEIGKGTTMDLYLPRAGAEASPDVGPRRVTPVVGVERILIIEDEVPVRRVIVRMVESLGYQVFSAGDSRDAMSEMEKVGATLDLVLVDVVLAGGVNGRELADRMLELRPNVKLMFMSGYIKDRSLLLGKDDKEVPLLRKPFTADELGAKIRMVLDGV